MSPGSKRDPGAVGAGFGLGLVAAAVLAVAPALRAAGSVSSFWVWLAAWGALAIVLGPLGALVRRARPLPLAAWCVPAGLLLVLPLLALFGRVLKAGTHHRPLGAVTFAVVAALLVLGAIAYGARVISELSARRGAEDFRAVRVLSMAAAGVMVLVALGVAIRALAGDAGLGRLALDGLLLLLAVGVVGWVPVPARAAEQTRSVALALWVVAAVAGVVALRRPEVAEVIAALSPLVRLLPLPVS